MLSAQPARSGDLHPSVESPGPPGSCAMFVVGRVGHSRLHPQVYTPEPQRHGLVLKGRSGRQMGRMLTSLFHP